MKKLLFIGLLFISTLVSAQSILIGMFDQGVNMTSIQGSTLDQVTFTFKIDVGNTIYVSWGDGTTTTVVGTGSNQNITSAYSTASTTYDISIYGNTSYVKSLTINESTVNILTISEIGKFLGLTELSLTLCKLNGGKLYDLPSGLTYLNLYNITVSSITGTFADLPRDLTELYMYNLIGFTGSGELSNLPIGLERLMLHTLPNDTITGTFSDLPSGLEYMFWYDLPNLTVTGTTATIPINVNYIAWANLPNLTVTGTFSDLPSGLEYMFWNNLTNLTVTGTTATLPTGSITFSNLPNLTVTGTTATLPSGLTLLKWYNLPNLTVTGTTATLPTGLVSITLYNLPNLTLTGNIDQLPSSINSTLSITSCSSVNIGYTGGTIPAWAEVTITFQNAWTSTELDDFLINWATTAGTGTKTIDLRGDNAARTSASDAAVLTLEGNGKTILTN